MSIEILQVIISTLFFLLVAVLGWIGSRVHDRLDNLTEMLNTKLGDMNDKLAGIERDLRGELVGLDRRVSHLEGKHGQ